MSSSTTSSKSGAAGFDPVGFDEFLALRDEPGWLIDRRRDAFAVAQKLPMPTLRDEEWRRTDIRGLSLDQFAPLAFVEPSEGTRAGFVRAYEALSGQYATGLHSIDSIATRQPDPIALGGAIFTDLGRASKEYPDILRKYLFTQAYNAQADAFAALHAAFWTGGTLLYLPKGVEIEAPLFTLIGLSRQGQVDLSHTLVVLEEGARASLVQETVSEQQSNNPALHLGGVELIVGDSARLRFVNIQNWNEKTWHFSRERAIVGRNASIQWTVGGLGSRLSKVNQEVALVGEAARAQINGVMFTTGRQHLAYFTRQDHAAPRTTSDLLYKGGLKDRSRLVWKGMIRVEPDAQKTDAYQKNDNLLLSESARADSIPGLEIEANDVRCTHGATAGRVDEEMIFYAKSRGLSRETAIRLVVEGFFANVYDRISLEPAREALRQAVAAKLEI
ncbi:MAG: Fe-S cluster assembly protein SufD [Isosphaeraceae bacterium]